MIMKCDRDESKNVNFDLAVRQAQFIHEAGASRLIGADEDVIFEILSKASRMQCQAIGEEYQKQFRMKLEKAINMKFKGNCAKLMLTWIQPLPQAVASLLSALDAKMIVDTKTIMAHVAKYDKDFLATVDAACETLYKKKLVLIVGRGMSGNLFKAVKGWIENLTPDKGFERIMDLYVEQKRVNLGVDSLSTNILSQDLDVQTRVKFLLEKQSTELKKYLIDNHIRFDPNDKFEGIYMSTDSFDESNKSSLANTPKNLTRGNTAEHLPAVNENGEGFSESIKSASAPASPSKSKSANIVAARNTVLTKHTKKSAESNLNEDQYQLKSDNAYNFLRVYFEKRDQAGGGELEAEVFWKYMKQLPLEMLGLNSGEVDNMRSFCDWDHDGVIHYYESLIELTDSVISSIERKEEDNDVLQVISTCVANEAHNVISDADTNTEKKLVRRETLAQFPNIPIYFMQYLHDTVEAFDLNCNGYLNNEELEQLLEVLNIPLTTAEFIGHEENMDSESNKHVAMESEHQLTMTLKNAVNVFAHCVKDWFLDADVDHYVCLVDKESGAYFWFNTRDESTTWATNLAGGGGDESPAPVNSDTKGVTSQRHTDMVNNPQAVYVGDAIASDVRRNSIRLESRTGSRAGSVAGTPTTGSESNRKTLSALADFQDSMSREGARFESSKSLSNMDTSTPSGEGIASRGIAGIADEAGDVDSLVVDTRAQSSGKGMSPRGSPRGGEDKTEANSMDSESDAKDERNGLSPRNNLSPRGAIAASNDGVTERQGIRLVCANPDSPPKAPPGESDVAESKFGDE
eukprot:gene29703-36795_t